MNLQMTVDWKQIDQNALRVAGDLKRSEVELIELLIQVDREKVFDYFGLGSTHAYCIHRLKLSDEQAYTYIRVARLSVKAPQVKQAIAEGAVTISKVKKMASAITPQNQAVWVEKAKTLSTKALEREVAIVSPRTQIVERVKPVARDLFELRCALDEETEKLLERVQDLQSQKLGKHTTASDVIKACLKEYVEKHDPVMKARRVEQKQIAVSTSKAELTKKAAAIAPQKGRRISLPAAVAHSVNRRDAGQCTFVHPVVGRCTSRRWIEKHHQIPVALGGENFTTNLTTLCSAHHRQEHKHIEAANNWS